MSLYVALEDFLDMGEEERLLFFELGYTLQSPQYDIIPRQLSKKLGYLFMPEHVNQGDSIPIVMSMTGLAESPLDFYIVRNGETIYSYMGDKGETSCSFLHKVTEPNGDYTMEAYVVDNSRQIALIDSKSYRVGYDWKSSLGLLGLLGVGLLGVIL